MFKREIGPTISQKGHENARDSHTWTAPVRKDDVCSSKHHLTQLDAHLCTANE